MAGSQMSHRRMSAKVDFQILIWGSRGDKKFDEMRAASPWQAEAAHIFYTETLREVLDLARKKISRPSPQIRFSPL